MIVYLLSYFFNNNFERIFFLFFFFYCLSEDQYSKKAFPNEKTFFWLVTSQISDFFFLAIFDHVGYTVAVVSSVHKMRVEFSIIT